MPARRKTADPDTVITYVRVSTEDQAQSGLGLDAQRAKLADEVDRRGWRVVAEQADEGISAKTIVGRPGLLAALGALDGGEAANLMVAKLDRLSRSVHDFTGLVDRSKRNGWSLVVMDLGVDTSTPSGAMMANVLASFAQFERELIAQRTSDALQALRRDGKVLGRPDRAHAELVARARELRDQGMTLAEIASTFNYFEVPTSQGGSRWYPSTVAAVLRRSEPAVGGQVSQAG
ncbi:recombinase family protein [Actinomycetospora endophytica]|uniref:Recombinase family protein n=1 Tax=Actinomycetospora endophytica TaxID=2291215 RepID=A0ABS8P5L9_9PSEU|nr:recombinase family protein [Actinomycetospora endophytica]MCD2193548.1 recombinase family protein [Actinomycetospora endophytica]